MLISFLVDINIHAVCGLILVTVEMRNVFVFCSMKLVARKAVYCSINVEFAMLSSHHCFVVTDTCAHTVMQTPRLMSLSVDCVVRTVTERAT